MFSLRYRDVIVDKQINHGPRVFSDVCADEIYEITQKNFIEIHWSQALHTFS